MRVPDYNRPGPRRHTLDERSTPGTSGQESAARAQPIPYRCTVVADACATRDLPDGRGGVLSAEIVHRANLAALADRCARVVGTADEIPDWRDLTAHRSARTFGRMSDHRDRPAAGARERAADSPWQVDDVWTNPVTQFSIRVEESAAATGGARLTLVATYAPYTPEPPAHYHPRQTEHFEVLAGRVRVRLDGAVRDLAAGDTLTINPGQRHQMWNPRAEPAGVRWVTEPALRTERWMGLLMALAQRGRTNAQGVPPLPQLALLLLAFRQEIRLDRPAPWLQALVLPPVAVLGRLQGLSAERIG